MVRDRSHLEETLRLANAEPSAQVSGEEQRLAERRRCLVSCVYLLPHMLLLGYGVCVCVCLEAGLGGGTAWLNIYNDFVRGAKPKQMCLHVNERGSLRPFEFLFLSGRSCHLKIAP